MKVSKFKEWYGSFLGHSLAMKSAHKIIIEQEKKILLLESTCYTNSLEDENVQLKIAVESLEASLDLVNKQKAKQAHQIKHFEMTVGCTTEERSKLDLQIMISALELTIDSWVKHTSELFIGRLKSGIISQRGLPNPDMIPVSVLRRNIKSFVDGINQL